ncbi:DinB family protein [Hugenholtzia roseola]|uniref:DinB family protein n=1 Tax=Hugenholtzia roseola TaxID=1002 RepID=UPI00040B6923|nr:DinB family protein [Hugenholtzia roseola]
MNLTLALSVLKTTRQNFMALMEKHTIEELNQIPAGFSNNLIWNFGHLVVTQQLLCYSLTGNKPHLDPIWIEKFRKGTKPEVPITAEEVTFLKEKALSLIALFEQDYQNGIFENFQTYTTSFGFVLGSIEGAITFNNTHEGLHYGYALALRKSLV